MDPQSPLITRLGRQLEFSFRGFDSEFVLPRVLVNLLNVVINIEKFEIDGLYFIVIDPCVSSFGVGIIRENLESSLGMITNEISFSISRGIKETFIDFLFQKSLNI